VKLIVITPILAVTEPAFMTELTETAKFEITPGRVALAAADCSPPYEMTAS
jgi:hypothetical protein